MVQGGIYPAPVVIQTIRRSLRGIAADVLLHLGQDVSVTSILDKMDSMFGNILQPESILETFFSAKQTETESVTAWACRLEHLLEQLRQQQQNHQTATRDTNAEEMLRRKFFSGLHSGPVQAALRHKLDSDASYKDLLVSARTVEMELQGAKKKATSRQATTPSAGMDQKLDKILASITALEERMLAVERRSQIPDQSQQQQQKQWGSFTQSRPQQPRQVQSGRIPRPSTQQIQCFQCGEMGHKKNKCHLNCHPPASGPRPQEFGNGARPRRPARQ